MLVASARAPLSDFQPRTDYDIAGPVRPMEGG